nr:hypothetical protein [Tanacetum cinerariifolium]
GRSPESRGSGGSAPGSRVQGAAAPGRVKGAEPLAGIEVSVIMTNGESVKDMTSKFDNPVWSENETLETTRKRMKWGNDDYICRGHILNEDASATKFLMSSFMNYKMVDNRPVME